MNLIFALGLLLVTALACNFSASTANISSLKIGKDANISTETETFAAGDTVYAAAVISNASEKLKVKGRLVADSVEGLQSGPVAGAEKTLEMEGGGTAKFSFTPGENGWPKGKYKMEVLMMNEAGEQKDQKTVSFTVS
ncbi:MAG TPA: hypothetical protein VGB17_14055 [Pyrinomonadaceae bacterium]